MSQTNNCYTIDEIVNELLFVMVYLFIISPEIYWPFSNEFLVENFQMRYLRKVRKLRSRSRDIAKLFSQSN